MSNVRKRPFANGLRFLRFREEARLHRVEFIVEEEFPLKTKLYLKGKESEVFYASAVRKKYIQPEDVEVHVAKTKRDIAAFYIRKWRAKR